MEIFETLNGTTTVFDDFVTENDFHGADIGAVLGLYRGPCLLDVTTKVALGNMRERVTIDGSTTVEGVYAAGCARRPCDVSRSTKDATAAALLAIQCLNGGE